IAWLVERTGAHLEELTPESDDVVTQALEAFRRFAHATRAGLQGDAPLLNPLERGLLRIASDRQAAAISQPGTLDPPEASAADSPAPGPSEVPSQADAP